MQCLLSLDIATRTGFAHWQPGMERPASGVKQLPSTGEDVGWLLDAYMEWLDELLAVVEPSHVVFEAAFVRTKKPNVWTEIKLLSMSGLTEVVCRRRGAVYFRAQHQKVMRHFVGHGNLSRSAGKAAVLKRCGELGWEPADDNAADALAVLDYSLDRLAIVPPWHHGTLFNRPEKIDAGLSLPGGDTRRRRQADRSF